MIFKKRVAPEPIGECYRSCSELPLHNFIKIKVEKSLKWLIKSGNPTNLDEVWANIHSEYCEMSGDGESARLLELSIQIPYLQNKLQQIQYMCDYMWQSGRMVGGFVEILQNTYGFRLTYADLYKDLKRTETQAKSDEVRLLKHIAEYNKATLDDGKQTSEADFEDNLTHLGKFQGYPLNRYTTSVSQYVSVLKNYNRANKPNGRE